MYVNFNFVILIAVFVAFTIGLNLGLHGIIALDNEHGAASVLLGIRRGATERNEQAPNIGQSSSSSNGNGSGVSQSSNGSRNSDSGSNQRSSSVKSNSSKAAGGYHIKSIISSGDEDISAATAAAASGATNSSSIGSSGGILPGSDSSSLQEKIARINQKVTEFVAAQSTTAATTATAKYAQLPIVLLTCNRASLLQQTITSLLAVRGVQKAQILVVQDGDQRDVAAVARSSGLQLLQHNAAAGLRGAIDGASRIALHYKFSLSAAFERFPAAAAVIIVEDDLLFSPDFLEFFAATAPVLDVDSSAFIVSAWSDNGFSSRVFDPLALRRTGYFPGLGWLLTRQLWQSELSAHWPSSHWDHWLRSEAVSRNRDIIYPQIPRSFHNGIRGTFMNLETHNKYFRDIGYNQDPAVSWQRPLQQQLQQHQQQHFLQAVAGTYDKRIELLVQQCKHVSSAQELLQHQQQLLCVWVDVSTACDGVAAVAFKPLATFFGLWHEHRRGNYKGLHEFYFGDDHSNYVLLFNIFEERQSSSYRSRSSSSSRQSGGFESAIAAAAGSGSSSSTFRHLMPPTARLLVANQFDVSLPQDLKRRQRGVRAFKAASAGMSCDEVCVSNSLQCDASQLPLLNTCAAVAEQFPCSSCQQSLGADQPAFVRPDAAVHLSPGKCLVSNAPQHTTCAAKHAATYRVCACH